MLLHLSKDSKGLQARAFRQLSHLFYISANYQSSWCELFNTRSYKKAKLCEDLVLQRYHRTMVRIIKEELNILKASYSEPRMIGSTRLIDVQRKHNQEYLITVIVNE